MNSVNEILNKMNIRLYSIRKPSILKNAGSESVRTDVFRSFPHFVFVGDDEINREWVFNLVGYLRYISYPCSWYGSQKKTYPGMNGSVRDHDVNDAPDSKQTETQDKTAKGIYVNEYENDLLICPVSAAEKHKDRRQGQGRDRRRSRQDRKLFLLVQDIQSGRVYGLQQHVLFMG